MTHQNDDTFADEIAERGLEASPELMRVRSPGTAENDKIINVIIL